MSEKHVLSAVVQDRDAYESIKNWISEKDLSDQGSIIYDMVESYYQTDGEADCVDIELLRERISHEYPKNESLLLKIVDNLTTVSLSNVQKDFLQLKKSRIEIDLSHALQAGNDEAIEQLMDEYNSYSNGLLEDIDEDSVYIGESVDTLLESVSPENLFAVYPKILSERLGGGVPAGTHMLVYALPEMGKSAFAINMACGFAKTGATVLYVANEEPHNLMLLRIISRLSGMTRQEIMENSDDAMEIANERGYENIIFASLSPGSIGDVERLANRYTPDIIFIDQLHNLSSKVANKVERLETQAKSARDLGGTTGAVVVSLTQAAESAEDKAVLEMGDVFFSNIGIQGHVDVMIGIGCDSELAKMDRRFLSLTKNKLSGDHDPCCVHLDRWLSKVTSL